MKVILTIITLLIPSLAFSQAGSFDSGSLIGGLIALAILIAIFLVLREVVMWYWKINTIINNQAQQIRTQQETNNLLSEQITLMKGYYNANHSEDGANDTINLSKSED